MIFLVYQKRCILFMVINISRYKFIHDAHLFWADTLKVVAEVGLRSEVCVMVKLFALLVGLGVWSLIGRLIVQQLSFGMQSCATDLTIFTGCRKCRHESLHPRVSRSQFPLCKETQQLQYGGLLIVFMTICKATVLGEVLRCQVHNQTLAQFGPGYLMECSLAARCSTLKKNTSWWP